MKSINQPCFYVDPRTVEQFDKKVLKRQGQLWQQEQDVFDDEWLKSVFYWHPDNYNKLPNKRTKSKSTSSPSKISSITQIQPENSGFSSSSSSSSETLSSTARKQKKQHQQRSCTPPMSDEELLKDRSAIFAFDFSSESDSERESRKTKDSKTSVSLTGFKFNPNVAAFQPAFY